ncbi:MAG: Holliday junction resolvase RuvX [Paludibacteraceae bacterium]|jgi:putative Holliday junction resolvase|nr:Holliday junction resolvase RuvX [Paludibacteraceae bacterium]
MARIVGIDFGEKRVGIASTDPLQIIANGVTTLPPNEAIDFLKKFVLENEVELFVVGKPKTLSNEPAAVLEMVEKFVEVLKAKIPTIPVEFVDERFTSVLAQRTMIDGGLKKKERQNKALVDKISATIILQTYLESKRNNNF